MIDKATETLLDALKRAMLAPGEQRLFKSGGRLIRHARYFVQLAESYLTSHLFCQIVGRIERSAAADQAVTEYAVANDRQTSTPNRHTAIGESFW